MKKSFFSIALIGSILLFHSCEEPVHEEYNLYGDTQEQNENNEDNPSGNCELFPLATGNTWVYNSIQQGVSQTLENTISGTFEYDGHTYYAFEPVEVVYAGTTSVQYSYLRKEGDSYYLLDKVEQPGVFETNYYSSILFKENMQPGESVTDNFTIFYNYLNGVTLTFDVNYSCTLEEILDTFEVNGTVYDDVYKFHFELQYSNGSTVEYMAYYGCNVGRLKYVNEEAGLDVTLVSYELN